MFIFPVLIGQNHFKSLSNKLDIGLNSLHRISPTTIKHIRTTIDPLIVNPNQTRYSGEHITDMVISIISDAKNVFIPMSLFFIFFNGLRNNNVVARQAVEILAVGIVGGVNVTFIVFRDEIDFHVFVVIFNQNLEISDECDFLSFHF